MDIDKQVKHSTQLLKYCHTLPKTELHAHLNGSIRKTTLLELLSNQSDIEAIGELYNQPRTFDNCFKIFQISSKIITDLNIIARITKEMIQDWAKVNCAYLEIRTSLKSINGKSKEDYLWTVLNEIKNGNLLYKNQMQTRLIISLNRNLDISDYLDTIEILKTYRDKDLKALIVVID